MRDKVILFIVEDFKYFKLSLSNDCPLLKTVLIGLEVCQFEVILNDHLFQSDWAYFGFNVAGHFPAHFQQFLYFVVVLVIFEDGDQLHGILPKGKGLYFLNSKYQYAYSSTSDSSLLSCSVSTNSYPETILVSDRLTSSFRYVRSVYLSSIMRKLSSPS